MRLRHAPNDYLQDAWSFVHVAFVVLEKIRPPICTPKRLSVGRYISLVIFDQIPGFLSMYCRQTVKARNLKFYISRV